MHHRTTTVHSHNEFNEIISLVTKIWLRRKLGMTEGKIEEPTDGQHQHIKTTSLRLQRSIIT